MKKKLGTALIGVLTSAIVLGGSSTVWAEEQHKTVDVMFLHDTHSHLNSFLTVEDG